MNVTLEIELSTLQKSSYGTQHNRCLDFSASRQSGSFRVMFATIRDQDVRTYFCVFPCTLVDAQPHRRGLQGRSTHAGEKIIVTRGLVACVLERLQAPHIYIALQSVISEVFRCCRIAAMPARSHHLCVVHILGHKCIGYDIPLPILYQYLCSIYLYCSSWVHFVIYPPCKIVFSGRQPIRLNVRNNRYRFVEIFL